MEEMENNNTPTIHSHNDERALKHEFNKGVVIGIILAVLFIILAVLGKNAYVIYSNILKGNIDYESKAKIIYDTLSEHYVDEISDDELYEGIYSGMVNYTTDQYSYYIPAESYEDFVSGTAGEYVGIGIVVSVDENENIAIQYVIEGSPAEKAGILPDDLLVSVDGVKATLENYYDVIDMVKGEEGTTVDLEIYRPAQAMTMEKTVERANIDTITVSHTMLDNDIGYIRISEFDSITYDQFKAALDELSDKGMKGVVMDVRDNPGGLLTSVTAVLDELLNEGVITYTEDKYGNKEYEYSTGDGIDIPVVVIANSSSASAAELFTAALKDRGVAKVVGETTYGKGIVQTTFPLSDGSAVKITTAKYYTPKGVCIQGIGIEPDDEVKALPDFELPYMASASAELADDDIQLEKAVEILKGEIQ